MTRIYFVRHAEPDKTVEDDRTRPLSKKGLSDTQFVYDTLLSTVEDKTGKVYDQYKNKGIETTFEMNPGNHFTDADLRLAKGIAWILK
jgi:phosphohistidine phosphatase SixA